MTTGEHLHPAGAGESLLAWLRDELLDADESMVDAHTRASMASDIGSLWRIDVAELGRAFLDAE